MSNSDATEYIRRQIEANGHISPQSLPDRPRPATALKTRIEQLERDEEFSIVTKDLSDEDYVVIKPFRNGAARLCNLHVWKMFKNKIAESSPRYFERREGVTRGEVHRLNHGLMSTDVQYALLSSLEGQFGDLDPLPLIQERAIRGFQLAIFSLENGEAPETLPNPELLIPQPALLLLFRLVILAEFRELRDQCQNDNRQLAEEDWTLIGGHLARELEMTDDEFRIQLGMDQRTETSIGHNLEMLHRRWGELVSRCRNAIPWRWLEE